MTCSKRNSVLSKSAARTCTTSVAIRLSSTQTARTGLFRIQLGWLEKLAECEERSSSSSPAISQFGRARSRFPGFVQVGRQIDNLYALRREDLNPAHPPLV